MLVDLHQLARLLTRIMTHFRAVSSIALTVTVSLFSFTHADPCQSGYLSIAGGCYRFESEFTGTWQEAKDFCESQGGHLAETRNEAHASDLITAAFDNPGNYWIGLTDMVDEGDFIWNHTNYPLSFSVWATNEPDGDVIENCVAMTESRSYFWTDEDCSAVLQPLCYTPLLLNPCSSGWSYVEETDSCYLLTKSGTESWSSAVETCKSMGSNVYLAEITSEKEQVGLVSAIKSDGLVGSSGYWIGLNDIENEGVYKWETSGEIAEYFSWAQGQPDSGTVGNCVALYLDWNWYDTRCSETFAWQPLCETRPVYYS